MLRFEEKAFVRQYYLEEMTKTMQTGWMLNEWGEETSLFMGKTDERR